MRLLSFTNTFNRLWLKKIQRRYDGIDIGMLDNDLLRDIVLSLSEDSEQRHLGIAEKFGIVSPSTLHTLFTIKMFIIEDLDYQKTLYDDVFARYTKIEVY